MSHLSICCVESEYISIGIVYNVVGKQFVKADITRVVKMCGQLDIILSKFEVSSALVVFVSFVEGQHSFYLEEKPKGQLLMFHD